LACHLKILLRKKNLTEHTEKEIRRINRNEKIIIRVIASPEGAAISFLLGIVSSLRFSE
jgi:hypothetical protein